MKPEVISKYCLNILDYVSSNQIKDKIPTAISIYI